jgi:hypothetical protein
MNKNFTIRLLNEYSKKELLNTKFSLVLEKEQALQKEFVYSINSYELLLAYIERDLLARQYVESTAELVEYYNKHKARNQKKKKFKDTHIPVVLDSFKNKAGIYMFINKVNKKFYIGKSNDLFTRIKFYTQNAINVSYSNSKIFRAMEKYGFNNFAFSIIEYCNVEDLNLREQFYIDLLRPQYNIRRKTHKQFYTTIKYIQI